MLTSLVSRAGTDLGRRALPGRRPAVPTPRRLTTSRYRIGSTAASKRSRPTPLRLTTIAPFGATSRTVSRTRGRPRLRTEIVALRAPIAVRTVYARRRCRFVEAAAHIERRARRTMGGDASVAPADGAGVAISDGAIACTAAYASTRPSTTPGMGTAVDSTACATCAAVAVGAAENASAAIPLTTGAADDVPRNEM